jgi:hypothetical protein
MSEKQESESQISRRKTLKTAGSIAAGVTLAGAGMLSTATRTASATDQASHSWDKNGSDEQPGTSSIDRGIYVTQALGWFGADYKTTDDQWVHDFRIEAHAKSQLADGSGGTADISDQSLAITSGTLNNLALYAFPEYSGMWPYPNTDTYDHYDVAFDVAQVLVSAVRPDVGIAWSAAEIAYNYIHTGQTGSGSGYPSYDSVHYSSRKHEATHFRWFEAFTDEYESVFDIISRAEGSSYNIDARSTMTVHIKKGYTPKEGMFNNYSINKPTRYTMSMQGTTPDSGESRSGSSFHRENGWVVERIPHGRIEERGRELNWTERRIERAKERAGPGEPLYHAHEAPIQIE